MAYYKKPQSVVRYDENGNLYLELLPITATPDKNYTDYSRISMIPVDNTPLLKLKFKLEFNKKRAKASKTLFELGTFPASLNPLAGTIIGGVYGGLAAKDAYENGLNWSNGIQLGLSLPLVGRGLYAGFNKGTLLAGKYAPKSLIGRWSRAYLINNSMRKVIKSTQNNASVNSLVKRDNFKPSDIKQHLKTDGTNVWELPIEEVFEDAINQKVPMDLIENIYTIPENINIVSSKNNFIPRYYVLPGKINIDFGDETLRRLEALGYDINSSMPIRYKSGRIVVSPKTYVNVNSSKPSVLGYFENEGLGGLYSPYYDVTLVDPIHGSPASIHFHERNMHGTDGLIEDLASFLNDKGISMYEDFIDNIFYDKSVVGHNKIPIKKLKRTISKMSDGNYSLEGRHFDSAHLEWSEARATLGELIRKLYWKVRQKGLSIQDVRPAFERYVRDIPGPDLIDMLRRTNDYGNTYGYLGPKNNPNFIKDLKYMLIHAPMLGVPIIMIGNNEKSGSN